MVWSGSSKTLSIWHARLGTYLGQVQRGVESEMERENIRKFLENSERDPRFITPIPINPLKVRIAAETSNVHLLQSLYHNVR